MYSYRYKWRSKHGMIFEGMVCRICLFACGVARAIFVIQQLPYQCEGLNHGSIGLKPARETRADLSRVLHSASME